MNDSGLRQQWLENLDCEVEKVVAGVNGPLFGSLLHATNYIDKECIGLFERGVLFDGPRIIMLQPSVRCKSRGEIKLRRHW